MLETECTYRIQDFDGVFRISYSLFHREVVKKIKITLESCKFAHVISTCSVRLMVASHSTVTQFKLFTGSYSTSKLEEYVYHGRLILSTEVCSINVAGEWHCRRRPPPLPAHSPSRLCEDGVPLLRYPKVWQGLGIKASAIYLSFCTVGEQYVVIVQRVSNNYQLEEFSKAWSTLPPPIYKLLLAELGNMHLELFDCGDFHHVDIDTE